MITSRSVLLTMRNVSDEVVGEQFVENRAVHEIMWENIVERGKPQMTI